MEAKYTNSRKKCIKTAYHGPTERRGSRVIASDCDNNKVILSWDNALQRDENHKMACKALCKKMGWTGNMVAGWYGGDAYWVWTD